MHKFTTDKSTNVQLTIDNFTVQPTITLDSKSNTQSQSLTAKCKSLTLKTTKSNNCTIRSESQQLTATQPTKTTDREIQMQDSDNDPTRLSPHSSTARSEHQDRQQLSQIWAADKKIHCKSNKIFKLTTKSNKYANEF